MKWLHIGMARGERFCFSVPLGETNEEFYQGIYTGQPLPTRSQNLQPPPLPSQPPAWQRDQAAVANDRYDRDGPSWVCTMCTFDNHPLMNKCEECDMPRLLNPGGSAGRVLHGQVMSGVMSFSLPSSIASPNDKHPLIPLPPSKVE